VEDTITLFWDAPVSIPDYTYPENQFEYEVYIAEFPDGGNERLVGTTSELEFEYKFENEGEYKFKVRTKQTNNGVESFSDFLSSDINGDGDPYAWYVEYDKSEGPEQIPAYSLND
jgi:hypothetical protein